MQITFITRQRIILIGLLVIAFLLTMIRHWIRYVLIIPVGIAAIFALGTIIFPLYQQGPNSLTFYKNQPSTLYISPGKDYTTSKIIIKNTKGTQSLDMTKATSFKIPTSISSIISLIASSKTGDENGFILLPEGSSIQLRPQSQITFLSQYPKIIITVEQGEVGELPSDNYSPRQLILSGVAQQDGNKNQYQQIFEKEKIKAIGTQGNGIFMQNTYLKTINKGMLNILVRLFPTIFPDSLTNFAAFEAYLPTEQIRKTDTTVDPRISQDMINQASRGIEETQIYQRWKKLFQ